MVAKLLKQSSNFFSKKQNSILSAATILMFASFASRILGLLRDRFLAATFFSGSEWQLDVYNAAFRIPDMLFQLLVLGALSSAFIPIYTNSLKKGEEKSWQIVYSVISISSLAFIFISLIFFIFSKQLCQIIAPNFSVEQINLMVNLTRIMLFGQVLLSVSNFFTGVLQSRKRFLLPAIAPLFYNLGIILGIFFFSPSAGIYGPTIGVLIGYLLHLLVQYPLIKKLGFSFRPMLGLKIQEVRKIGKLMLPRTLGLAIEQIELTIAVALASAMTAGSLSIFYFSQHLHALPVGIFGITIGQAALPVLSQETGLFGPYNKFKETFLNSFKNILYLALPSSVLLLILRIPVVRIAFGARNFPWEATLKTGQTLSALSISIAAYAVIQLLVRAFYALEDTKTPLYIGLVTVITNVFLSIFFTQSLDLDVFGLALAISISGIIQAFALFIALDFKLKHFNLSDYLSDVIKMLIASFLTGIALWMPMRLLDKFVLDTTRTIDLIILTVVVTVIGLLVYLAISKILQIDQLTQFTKLFSRFGQYKNIFAETEESLSEASISPSTSSPDN